MNLPEDVREHIGNVIDELHGHSSFCIDAHYYNRKSDDELRPADCLAYDLLAHRLLQECNPDDLDCYCNWTPLERTKGIHQIPEERQPAPYKHTCQTCQGTFMHRWDRDNCEDCTKAMNALAAKALLGMMDKNPNFLRDEFGL